MKRALLVHNYYQQSGGEDKVVSQELKLLRTKGLDAQLYSVHNDRIKTTGFYGKAKIAIDSTWSIGEYNKLKKKLMDMKPDVVHVHNFFPLLSPSIYYACKNQNIPVVQTLHNYRLICPAATFMRNNEICEKCLDGSLIHSIKHGCYRDSKFHTLPVAAMIKLNRVLGTWVNKVDQYIALTEFAKRKFVESGIPEDRISVKPNFISQGYSTESYPSSNSEHVLFVGRISVEKGVENLLQAWKQVDNKNGMKLLIIGDGTEKEALSEKYISKDVEFLGNQSSDVVLSYMKSAKYLIVPSIWYEGFPMTIVESYSMGTPVICSKLGSLQEVVRDGETGFHFKHDDIKDISKVISNAIIRSDYEKLRKNVLSVFHKHYSEDVNYSILYNIYQKVIKYEEDHYVSSAKTSVR
ncbi:glycosyltransferase [Paenibacillus tarimensis]